MIRHILAGNIRLLVPRAPLVLAKTPAAASDDARGTWVIHQKVSESNNETDRHGDWLVSCVYNATTRPFWHSLQLAARRVARGDGRFFCELCCIHLASRHMLVWNLQLMIRHILAGNIRLLVPRAPLVLAKTPAAASGDAIGTWVIQQKVSESNNETDRNRDWLVNCVYNATTRPFWHSLQLAVGVCCGTCSARRGARADGRFYCELCCIHCARRQMRVWNLQLMIRHTLAGSIRLLVPRALLVLAKTPAAASDDAIGTWVIQQKVSESNNETDREIEIGWSAVSTMPRQGHFGIVCSWQLACVVAHAELVELQEQTSDSSLSFVAFTARVGRYVCGTSS